MWRGVSPDALNSTFSYGRFHRCQPSIAYSVGPPDSSERGVWFATIATAGSTSACAAATRRLAAGCTNSPRPSALPFVVRLRVLKAGRYRGDAPSLPNPRLAAVVAAAEGNLGAVRRTTSGLQVSQIGNRTRQPRVFGIADIHLVPPCDLATGVDADEHLYADVQSSISPWFR